MSTLRITSNRVEILPSPGKRAKLVATRGVVRVILYPVQPTLPIRLLRDRGETFLGGSGSQLLRPGIYNAIVLRQTRSWCHTSQFAFMIRVCEGGQIVRARTNARNTISKWFDVIERLAGLGQSGDEE
jgi:hypothetical protein